MESPSRAKLWVAVVVAVVALPLIGLGAIPQLQFLTGGVLINLGYRMQDRLQAFDLIHEENLTPQQVWLEMQKQNDVAARVRETFPRSTRHPLVALLVCMDARIDTSELVGDTRRYYYLVRTAGSVLGRPEQEMLELAVRNGVRLLVLTTHTDCAAERVARTPELRAQFPSLVALLDQRKQRVDEFKQRPAIRAALAAGALQIKMARIDTKSDRLIEER